MVRTADNGDTIAVGAENGGSNGAGAVMLYISGMLTYPLQADELRSQSSGDFGHSVDMADGVIVVGAPGAGAAYIFERNDVAYVPGGWFEAASLVPSGGLSTYYGWDVALAPSGRCGHT